jgi:HlyD family secretion protein
LTIPVLAVLQFQGKDHVSRKIDDQFVQTDVELGVSNEKYFEVLKGLSEGDVLAMSPMSLMTDAEKQAAFGSASKGGKKDWGEEKAAEGGEPAAPAVGGPTIGKKVADAGPGIPGKGGDPARAKGKGAGGFAKGKGAGGRGAGNPIMAKLKGLSAEEKGQLFRSGTDEEKAEIAKKAGLTDAELEQMKSFGGGGGGGGGFGGGGGRRGGGRPGGGGEGAGGSDQ